MTHVALKCCPGSEGMVQNVSYCDIVINNKKYKVPNGIAHFMEHIKFNVKKGVTANDLFSSLIL